MLLTENKYTNVSGTFPNALMIDASGAGLTDGSEFAALPLNDGWEPFSQAVMSYASGVQLQNSPTGGVGVPNGVADAVGVSQMLEAIQKSIGNGPGNMAWWGNELDPSVTGDRILLLAEQGVLIAVYPGLDAANYVGDGNNMAVAAAGGKFYRSSDAGGVTPNIAGPYIQLPAQPEPTFTKTYIGATSGADFDVSVIGATLLTVNSAFGIVEQTSDGSWWWTFSISVTNTAADPIFDVAMSGIAAKNTHAQWIGVTDQNVASQTIVAGIEKNGGNIRITSSGAGPTTVLVFGKIILESKPTWADDFEFKLGIRY
ncbi:MAG: hypothetical protein GWP06_00370 [Actinobacteria bacterium]|nr:hypothetical protein [Actinomycetota bacterium]